jgi:hypothetical protein
VAILSTALFLLASQAPTATPTCALAERQYQALDLDKALATAVAVLEHSPERPLECLEISALALLVLGRTEEAKGALVELFERAPDRSIRDESLAPATRALIEQTRAELVPLAARVTARWIVHESLRVDFALDGGLRGARSIRFDTTVGPGGETSSDKVDLEGRAATATVTVAAGVDAKTMAVAGRVTDALGREVHQFSSQILLPDRPDSSEQIVEVESGPAWWIWAVVGAVVVGSAVTVAVVAQPTLPEPAGIGRAEVPE